MRSAGSLAFGLSLLSAAAAQTSTTCNPTEKTCPSDEGLDQSTYSVDFTQGANDDWNVTYGTITYDNTNGATYTISQSGDAPTVQSNWYIFFGEITVEMKTAPGTGIVSCAILESDDLDEIDWEWLGGTTTQVETNYFGKGNTTTYDREQYVDMANTQEDFHNYTLVWTKESLTWKVDGSTVRTLTYASAGNNYPQSPMRVKLGIWAGGDSSNSEGTIEWAGGETDYSDGPFTAYVKSVSITNYNPAASYSYSDTSGSYDSITLSGANTTSSTTTTSSTETDGGSSSGTTYSNGTVSSTNSTASPAGSLNSTSSSSSSGSSSGSSSSSSSSSSASTSSSASSSNSSSIVTSAGIAALDSSPLGASAFLAIVVALLV